MKSLGEMEQIMAGDLLGGKGSVDVIGRVADANIKVGQEGKRQLLCRGTVPYQSC